MTWKQLVTQALENLGGEAFLSEIYRYIMENSIREFPNSWQAIIRRTLETNSSDSVSFDGQEDLYYSVDGIGNGKWGLREFEVTEINMDSTQDDAEFSEGRSSLKKHLIRERNHHLIKLAKERSINRDGELKCFICNFNFTRRYGDIGKGFIEAHHIKPVSAMLPNEKTKLDDIVLVCSNCHSMIHRKKPWLNRFELKSLLID